MTLRALALAASLLLVGCLPPLAPPLAPPPAQAPAMPPSSEQELLDAVGYVVATARPYLAMVQAFDTKHDWRAANEALDLFEATHVTCSADIAACDVAALEGAFCAFRRALPAEHRAPLLEFPCGR